MTDLRAFLAPIRARLAAATPGPWANYGDLGHEVYAPNAHDDDEPDNIAASVPCLADAHLIANAPTDLSRLLAAIEAIESLVDEFEESSEGFGLDLQDDDFERGWHGARRETVAMIRTALAAALGSDTTNQEGSR